RARGCGIVEITRRARASCLLWRGLLATPPRPAPRGRCCGGFLPPPPGRPPGPHPPTGTPRPGRGPARGAQPPKRGRVGGGEREGGARPIPTGGGSLSEKGASANRSITPLSHLPATKNCAMTEPTPGDRTLPLDGLHPAPPATDPGAGPAPDATQVDSGLA